MICAGMQKVPDHGHVRAPASSKRVDGRDEIVGLLAW